ncbi:hypothetical protein AOLI_G00272310 [Acnodon oligacanthus]
MHEESQRLNRFNTNKNRAAREAIKQRISEGSSSTLEVSPTGFSQHSVCPRSGAEMSAGDVVCTGWLVKSPPEKKLKRYRPPEVLLMSHSRNSHTEAVAAVQLTSLLDWAA